MARTGTIQNNYFFVLTNEKRNVNQGAGSDRPDPASSYLPGNELDPLT